MKKSTTFQAFVGALLLGMGQLRADPLDEMITTLRSGAEPSRDGASALAAYKAASEPVSKAYRDGIADLYLLEIKYSIVDPDHNGGWPYRSFLLDRFLAEDDGIALRRNLTDQLKQRFADKPDPVLAYALVCPALYAGDEELVAQLQAYLKDHDPYLFKREQAALERSWRPGVKAALARDASDMAALRTARFQRLVDLMVQYGHDTTLSSPVTTILGLAAQNETITLRQLTIDPKATDPNRHAYMRTADGGFLLLKRTTVSARAYRADAKQELMSAVEAKPGKEPTVIPMADARKELAAEFDYWIAIASQF